MSTMDQTRPPMKETVQLKSSQLVEEVKRIIHEGNVRRIVVKQDERTILEFPLAAGVIGTLLAPSLAALGAVSALLTDCTIEVERVEPAPAVESPATETVVEQPVTVQASIDQAIGQPAEPSASAPA